MTKEVEETISKNTANLWENTEKRIAVIVGAQMTLIKNNKITTITKIC
jgi:hypothetical protein